MQNKTAKGMPMVLALLDDVVTGVEVKGTTPGAPPLDPA